MGHDLRDAFEELADRGTPAGAETVVARAVAEADGHTVVPLAPTRRRRRPVRTAIAASVAVALIAIAAVGGGLLSIRTKLGDIERIDLSQELAGVASVSEPLTVLVVGSDSRADLGADDEARFGSPDEVSGQRADTILVLRLDPGTGRAAALSLPRDLWVAIAGTGREERINTALSEGPGVLVETVQDVLGIHLDHYVEFDFDGFRRVVDAVGGVTVRLDTPVRDRVTGLLVPEAGCRRLDGDEALALVRSRHEQRLVDGRWVTDPTGDLGRIERQQRFLLAMLRDVGAARSPLTLARLLDVAADEVRVDDGLSADDLLRLSRRVGSFSPDAVRFVAVPVAPGRVNGASVLLADDAELAAAGAALLAGPREAPVAGGAESPATSAPRPSGC